jgi:hypothetical protein
MRVFARISRDHRRRVITEVPPLHILSRHRQGTMSAQIPCIDHEEHLANRDAVDAGACSERSVEFARIGTTNVQDPCPAPPADFAHPEPDPAQESTCARTRSTNPDGAAPWVVTFACSR